MKESIFGRNKEHLSYSSWKLWKTSKDQYRRRYYEGEKGFVSLETEFGNKIHEMIENRDPLLSHIPQHSISEHPISVYIEGNKVIGRIDSFDEEKVSFLDWKTSHATKEGKAPWDKLKVRKLEQLPFYSMLLREKYGKVNTVCHLVWIETEFKDRTIEFDGHILETEKKELVLTGKVKKFRRTIAKWERKRMREDLIKTANEIKKDYVEYTTSSTQVHVGDFKERTQEVS